MKKFSFTSFLVRTAIWVAGIITCAGLTGQSQTTFTFTGINNTDYLQVEKIMIINLTIGCDTTLHYPDTVLTIYNVGIKEDENTGNESFQVWQNYPNPSADLTYIRIFIPEKGMVKLQITGTSGRQLLAFDRLMDKGFHSFRLTLPGEGLYLFSARWNNTSSTIRMVSAYTGPQRPCAMDYTGCIPSETPLKSLSATTEFVFSPGDQLLLIGYADTVESGFLDAPETSQNYIFQFASNIPCPGLDSLLYDGQWYHTIQVFSQCWIKENLNAGQTILSGQDQTNNGIIEKYCMSDMSSACDLFGGLYFWDEMMNYTYVTGGQGICPDGFHVPTDLEWQILEGAADSEYEIGGPEWKVSGWRGTDAGGNLKQTGTELWEYPNTGATDAYGFTVIPSGYFVQGGYWGPGYKAYLWSSNNVWMYYRNFDWNRAQVQRNTGGNELAISVRCIRN